LTGFVVSSFAALPLRTTFRPFNTFA
jgi:hypothetical protein